MTTDALPVAETTATQPKRRGNDWRVLLALFTLALLLLPRLTQDAANG
jgi:hypothetical protein